jgi:hypothetical protein
MARPTVGQVTHAMWANRPNLLELLFLAIVVLATHWAVGVPLALLTLLIAALVAGGTLRIALTELRHRAATELHEADDGPEGGRDAD